MVCIAGVLGNKQVALGPLAVEAGIFAFLMLVVTSSAVAELYGRATADRLVLIGFVPLITAIAADLHRPPVADRRRHVRAGARKPSRSSWARAARLMAAGIIAYGVSMLNVIIFSRLSSGDGAGWSRLRAGDRQRAEPDRRHADLHHRRLLRRAARSPT